MGEALEGYCKPASQPIEGPLSFGTLVHVGIQAQVPTPLFGVVGQIQWADQQIRSLQSDIEAFVNDQPYFISRNLDLKNGDIVFRHTSLPLMPYDFSPRIGSIVSSLRAALDYLAVQLINTSRKPKPKGKIYFPIRKDRREFLSAMKTDPVIKAMRHGSRKLLYSAKPYKGGNDALWLVNELGKRVKHNNPIFLDTEFFLVKSENPPAPMIFDQFNIHKARGFFQPKLNQSCVGAFPIGQFGDISGLKKLPWQEPDAVVVRCKVGGNFSQPLDFEFAFRISLSEPDIVTGQPIIPTLDRLTLSVRKVCESFFPLFGHYPTLN